MTQIFLETLKNILKFSIRMRISTLRMIRFHNTNFLKDITPTLNNGNYFILNHITNLLLYEIRKLR